MLVFKVGASLEQHSHGDSKLQFMGAWLQLDESHLKWSCILTGKPHISNTQKVSVNGKKICVLENVELLSAPPKIGDIFMNNNLRSKKFPLENIAGGCLQNQDLTNHSPRVFSGDQIRFRAISLPDGTWRAVKVSHLFADDISDWRFPHSKGMS